MCILCLVDDHVNGLTSMILPGSITYLSLSLQDASVEPMTIDTANTLIPLRFTHAATYATPCTRLIPTNRNGEDSTLNLTLELMLEDFRT